MSFSRKFRRNQAKKAQEQQMVSLRRITEDQISDVLATMFPYAQDEVDSDAPATPDEVR